MVAEAALAVVVLAVDVVGDGAADRHLTSARQHRDPQAERQCGLHQLVEAHPAVDVDDCGVDIDIVDVRCSGVMSTVRPPVFCADSL